MPIPTTQEIKNLSLGEKIELMEHLWRDISAKADDIPVPEWHLRILNERERKLANGETAFIDFEEAIADIRNNADVLKRTK